MVGLIPVIKRLRFLDGLAAADPDPGVDAPDQARPARITVATVLSQQSGPAPKHAAVVAEWFDDAAHLAQYEAWAGADPGPSVVAEEYVMRGAEWLDRRWRHGGQSYKHIALATRAADLTPAEFADRWRNHAGRSGGVVIPDEARGQAYVQNHPVQRATGEWVYDAVTEVWFDDLAGLQARIDWFDENPPGDSGLFRQSWFLAVTEELVLR